MYIAYAITGLKFLSLSLKKLQKIKIIINGKTISGKISQVVPTSLKRISKPYIFGIAKFEKFKHFKASLFAVAMFGALKYIHEKHTKINVIHQETAFGSSKFKSLYNLLMIEAIPCIMPQIIYVQLAPCQIPQIKNTQNTFK